MEFGYKISPTKCAPPGRGKSEEAKMRIALLLAVPVLASCTMASGPIRPDARAQQKYAELIAGKVPQKPISCIPNYSYNEMTTLDGRTVAFRLGNATTYMVHLTPGCEMIAGGSYALLSHQFGGMGTCEGDIQRVLDTSIGSTVGGCAIAEIVPYVRR